MPVLDGCDDILPKHFAKVEGSCRNASSCSLMHKTLKGKSEVARTARKMLPVAGHSVPAGWW